MTCSLTAGAQPESLIGYAGAMLIPEDIESYHRNLPADDKKLCKTLFNLIGTGLPESEPKVWHGHPVWFLAGNPVVGYSLKKSGIEILFWSGQSFKTTGLRPIGKFKAAAYGLSSEVEIETNKLLAWLNESRET